MQMYRWKVGCSPLRFVWVPSLCLCCFALSFARPACGQAPLPRTAPAQEAPAPLPDPFYVTLEALSKKYGVAIIAEGIPLPATKKALPPAAQGVQEGSGDPVPATDPAPKEEATDAASHKNLSPEEDEVQKVAEKYDYDVVHQGKVYLLIKRYTNLDDIPDITPEECLFQLRDLAPANDGFGEHIDGGIYRKSRHGEKETVSQFNYWMHMQVSNPRIDGFRKALGYTDGVDGSLQNSAYMPSMLQDFWLESHQDRAAWIYEMLEHSLPLDPILRWKRIENHPVFGFDTRFRSQDVEMFLPVSDLDRSLVAPYGVTVPRPDFSTRYDMILRNPDPTDPAFLSEATKRFLDDNGKSSRSLTLGEVIATLNKRAAKNHSSKIYQVRAMYAAKRLTAVGMDTLAPETLMEALAAVYGLGVQYDRNTLLLSYPWVGAKNVPDPSAVGACRVFWFYDAIPRPLYRAMQTRIRAWRLKMAPTPWLEFRAQAEYLSLASEMRDSWIRMFRYLTEPQVKAQPKQQIALSHVGEPARKLFALSRMIAAFADACAVVDFPVPPYITNFEDRKQNVRISGGVHRPGESPLSPSPPNPLDFTDVSVARRGYYRRPDGNLWLSLFVTYTNPKTGEKYGPLLFFDAPMNPEGYP